MIEFNQLINKLKEKNHQKMEIFLETLILNSKPRTRVEFHFKHSAIICAVETNILRIYSKKSENSLRISRLVLLVFIA